MLECDVHWTWESRGGASGSICCSVSWIITAGIEGNVEEWDGEEGPASTKGGMVNMENGLADERWRGGWGMANKEWFDRHVNHSAAPQLAHFVLRTGPTIVQYPLYAERACPSVAAPSTRTIPPLYRTTLAHTGVRVQ
jgi:hypothetical protein